MDPALAVASFDTAWTRIRATYYDPTFRGNDWNAVRATFRPLAERATTPAQLRQAVESLFVRLEDSHFTIIPGDVVTAMRTGPAEDEGGEPGDAGLQFRLVGERLLVSHVATGSTASASGVRPGWEVVGVGTVEIAPMLAARRALTTFRDRRRAGLQIPLQAESATHGGVGSVVNVVFQTPEGREVRLDLLRSPFAGEVVRYGPLPPQYFRFTHQKYVDDRGCVAVIHFSVWMLPLLPALERAMDDVGSCRGIVLDLRGNTGGVAAMVMGVAGFFVDREVALGTLSGRSSSFRYVVNPRRSNRRGETLKPYGGSLAILVDGLSASTTEIFAEGMRDIGRARVFGDTTAGQALPAAMAKLPNGDLLIHAIADYHSANGRRIEATGVAPDVVLPLTRKSLSAGRDVALAASLAWAGGQPIETAAGVTQRALRP
ncbi:MAG: hypothetical protein H7066_16735 [Cytophagaceae bacterium]|nr:hypothetical protein [Gemmatimonadaceae bacterium]